MKWFLIVPATLIILVVVYFSILGVKSRAGSAPGPVDGQLQPCDPKPNSVCSMPGNDDQHAVEALDYMPLSELALVIREMGGEVVVEQDNYIASEFRSGLFGFVDDLELQVDKNSAVIHVRSASRVGYSDMGVNRQRVETLRNLVGERR
ncbi:MAG: DUF1499 domain-containing protein [Amphritea sp.]|nr:DUF1499 domain-containing protein [Amphritea sp.]